VGVGLHLVRDLATGPGLRLLWPLSGRGSRAPYPPYAAAVLAAAAVASRRCGPALPD
jgi:inner membrane protein